jgi:hypothetical protein
MPRSLVVLLTLLVTAVAAAPATATATTDRCRPGPGEHRLARSAQAVVLERVVQRSGSFPRQTIVGCSRRSGHRRTLDTLQRVAAPTADPTRLIGVRLAGTRVAYLKIIIVDGRDPHPVLIADDALHGGRRHDLSSPQDSARTSRWPFGSERTAATLSVVWTLDAQGDVAWIATDGKLGVPGAQALGVWRAGLGRRQIDSHAALGDATLHDGVLRWRRNGSPRVVDLKTLPPSRCGVRAAVGTLDLDFVRAADASALTACLRSTGQTVSVPGFDYPPEATDVDGAYIVMDFVHVELEYTVFIDVARGTWSEKPGGSRDMVVDANGSRAWLTGGEWTWDDTGKVWLPAGLWVDDASGLHKAADLDPAIPAGPLLRDGATVTWAGGPTVTLNP